MNSASPQTQLQPPLGNPDPTQPPTPILNPTSRIVIIALIITTIVASITALYFYLPNPKTPEITQTDFTNPSPTPYPSQITSQPTQNSNIQLTNNQQTSIPDSITINNAYYDANCTVIIELSNNSFQKIPTDHQQQSPDLKCHQIKRIQISPDKQYLAFEGSDWHTNNPADGNNLTIYMPTLNTYATWSTGFATIQQLNFDTQNNLTFEAKHPDDPFILKETISVPTLQKIYSQAVDPITKEIKLIDGIVINQ